jgi:hypothetical protein
MLIFSGGVAGVRSHQRIVFHHRGIAAGGVAYPNALAQGYSILTITGGEQDALPNGLVIQSGDVSE